MRLSFCVNIAMQTPIRLSDVINQYARMIDARYAEDFELWPESNAQVRHWRMSFNHAISFYKRLFKLIMYSATANDQNVNDLVKLLRGAYSNGWTEFVLMFFPSVSSRASWADIVHASQHTKFIFLDSTTHTLPLL